MKKARITPIVLATALVAILQPTPAAAELKTQTVDYKHGDAALEGGFSTPKNKAEERANTLSVATMTRFFSEIFGN